MGSITERGSDRAAGQAERSLWGTYRTGLGVPYECESSKYGAAPALTVRKEDAISVKMGGTAGFPVLWKTS